MGRMDRSGGQDAVMRRRHINDMLHNIEEYELVKSGCHERFKVLEAFYESKGLCRQNFLKYYRRYLICGRDVNALIPRKVGRKFRKELGLDAELAEKIRLARSEGYNRFEISFKLKRFENIELSPSAIYRLFRRLGINQLNPIIKEDKRRIIKMSSGELGHIDIHYIAKNTIKEFPRGKFYLLGLIDSYSRICWLEVIDSIKAINVSFAAMNIMFRLKERYDIKFKEMMSDNGVEFASRNNPLHPFERMLSFYDIKHRYTKPCSPKTNGKIERFWRTIEEELLSNEQFETLEEFKQHIVGYCIYYNEHRLHQGINNKMPVEIVRNCNM